MILAVITVIGYLWREKQEDRKELTKKQHELRNNNKRQLETYLSQARSGKLDSLPLIQPILKAFTKTLDDPTSPKEHLQIAADGIEALFRRHNNLLRHTNLVNKHFVPILRAIHNIPLSEVCLSLIKALWYLVVKDLPRENLGLLRHLKETPLLHAPLAKINQKEQAWTSPFIAVLTLLTQHENKEIQYRTAIMLTWLTRRITDAHTRHFLTALQDTDWRVRLAALAVLGKLKKFPPEAIPFLLTALHDKDWSVRLDTVEVLGKFNKLPPEAIKWLVSKTSLVATKDVFDRIFIRVAAIKVLGKLNELPPEAIQPLLAAIKGTDQGARVAAGVLGKFNKLPPEAIQSLLADFENANDVAGIINHTHSLLVGWMRRREIIEVLGEFNKLPPEAIQLLRAAIKDDYQGVRVAAIEVLGKFNKLSPEAIQSLIADFENADQNVRLVAAEVLGKLDFNKLSENTTHSLRKALKSTDWRVRCVAIEVLGKFNKLPENATHSLLIYIKANDPTVRQFAASALRYTNQRPGIEALLRVALSDPHPKVRDAAHESLLTVGKAPLLAQILADPKASELTRGRAADYLGFRCDPRDIAASILPLYTALHKTPASEWTVRARAAHALGWLAPHLLTDKPDNKTARNKVAHKTLLDLQKQAATLHPVVRTAVEVALHRIERAQRKAPPDFLDRRRQQRCDAVLK